ncbi:MULTISPECIES: cation diffusion facilitator family transporter [unclassified Phenylobacterium]|uniref:cation diffusion facilitator family transporter n=1 Tax=unclassified Phenylobacterium TaxID=2640670 RepID=UPI002151F80D|nr:MULTISPECIES: cation diffusion facilitator family transporter [unclassified Phenylobacterium]
MSHDHVFLGERHDENARRTLWVVALTAVMMVGEIIAGSVFNSMALLADGFHMATHAGALAVAAAAYAYARRHARSRRFSFGTGKVGDLAGFASALVLALIALAIGVESVVRLLNPQPVSFGEATLVAVVGLAVNVVSALLLSGGTITIMATLMFTSIPMAVITTATPPIERTRITITISAPPSCTSLPTR